MNKKQLQLKAGILLKQWQGIEEDKRGYENQSWHAVNVKRYNDYVDIDDLLKSYPKQYRDELKKSICNDDGDVDVDIYYSWLDVMRDQLRYELKDIANFTKGCKDEHKDFEHIVLQGRIREEDYKTKCNACGIKTYYEDEQPCKVEKCHGTLKKITYKQEWDEREYIYFLGRSGGWACFQDLLDDDVENNLQAIADWKLDEISDDDILYSGEYSSEEDLQNDLADYLNKVKEIIAEITYIENYITKFNKSLDFKDEVKYRLDEKLEDIKEDNRIKQEDDKDLIADLRFYADDMQKRLDEHKKHKELKDKIQRHLTGIKKTLQ